MRVARTVSLDSGLPNADGIALLRDLDHNGELGLLNAPDELLQDVVQRCYGVPHALETIAGILEADPNLAPAQLLENTALFNEQVVENLIAEHYRRVTDDQQRVLAALAVYNKPVPADAVRYLLEPFYPNVDVDVCLRYLVLNHFVTCQRGRDTYELHFLDQEYAYSCIPDDGDYTKRMLHHRTAEFCLSLLTGNERQDLELQLQGWEHWFKAEEYEEAAKLALVISRKLRELRRYVEIVVLYHATARTASQFPTRILALAIDCLCMMGHIEEQEALLKESANSIDPLTRGLVLELTARFYADRGNYTTAISAAEESLSILLELVRKESSPQLREQLKLDTVQATHTIAFCLYLQGLYDEAIKQFQDARRLSDELGAEGIRPYQYFLADSLRMVGLLEEAKCVMETVLQMDDEKIPPAAFMVWGQILQDEGDLEGAWNALQQAKTIANHQGNLNALSRIEWAIGRWYLLNEQFNSALKSYLYARDLFYKFGWCARFAMVQQEIGLIQHHLYNLPEARRYYEESIAVDIPPANYSCTVKLGVLCLEEAKVEEAQSYLARGIVLCRELLEKTPRFYDALYHLGLAQLGSGQSDDAIATYQRALEVCSARGVVQSALQDLQLLKRVLQPITGLDEAIRRLEGALNGKLG